MRPRQGAADAVKRLIIKALRLGAQIGIFGALFWYGINAVNDPDKLDKFIIGLTVFGVTYGICRPLFEAVSEVVGGIMVIAEFLNRHLLEPQKQRLLEEGRKGGLQEGREEGRKEGLEEGRARERAEILTRLEELGLDPDQILPPESSDTSTQE